MDFLRVFPVPIEGKEGSLTINKEFYGSKGSFEGFLRGREGK